MDSWVQGHDDSGAHSVDGSGFGLDGVGTRFGRHRVGTRFGLDGVGAAWFGNVTGDERRRG